MTEQHLLKALEQTQRLYLFYHTLSLQGNTAFSTLAQNTYHQVDALLYWIQQQAINTPPSTPTPLKLGSNLTENLEIALSQEHQQIDLYNQMLETETHMGIRDLFYQFQATSYQQHLPLLRQSLAHSYQTIMPDSPPTDLLSELEKSKAFLSQAGEIMNEFKSGTINEEKLGGFLSNLNYSLVGGIVLGGISAMIFNEILNKNKE